MNSPERSGLEASNKSLDQKNVISDPESWVDDYGDYLYSYALSWVGDKTIAEDLVQVLLNRGGTHEDEKEPAREHHEVAHEKPLPGHAPGLSASFAGCKELSAPSPPRPARKPREKSPCVPRRTFAPPSFSL